MIVRIQRQTCLDHFSNFPLREYDPAEDDEKVFYPEVYASSGWLSLSSKTDKSRTSILPKELTKLVKAMGYEKLIFLGDTDLSWISDLCLERNDYRPLKEAVAYFLAHKVGKKFNGALEIDQVDFLTFFKHFYVLTRCGGPVPYFHFTDKSQNIIGYIHYTGEVRIDALNKKTAEKISEVIPETYFNGISDS